MREDGLPDGLVVEVLAIADVQGGLHSVLPVRDVEGHAHPVFLDGEKRHLTGLLGEFVDLLLDDLRDGEAALRVVCDVEEPELDIVPAVVGSDDEPFVLERPEVLWTVVFVVSSRSASSVTPAPSSS